MKNFSKKFGFLFILIFIFTLASCNSTVTGFKFDEYTIDNSLINKQEELTKDEGMVIDGILDEAQWEIAQSNAYTITHTTYPDVTATSMCYLGEEGVYFGVVVNDTHIYYNEERKVTRNSSVEIEVRGIGDANTRAYNMIVAPTGNGNEIQLVEDANRRLGLTSSGKMDWMACPFKWEGAATIKGNINTSTNEGYIAETFIPWSELGVTNHKYVRTYVAMNHVEAESTEAGRSWGGEDGNNQPHKWRIASNKGLVKIEDIMAEMKEYVLSDEYMSIDGELNESQWEGITPAEFSYISGKTEIALSAKSYMTDKGAYFGFVVKDDDVYYSSERKINANSAMEILFAPNGSKQITLNCLQLRITANNVSVGYTGDPSASYPWVVNPFEVLSATTIQGNLNTSGNEGYTIELFIPWTSFGSNERLNGVLVCPSIIRAEDKTSADYAAYCNFTNAKVDKQTNPTETFIYMEEDGAVLKQMTLPSLFLTNDMLNGDYYEGTFDISAGYVSLSPTASSEKQLVEPNFVTPENVEIINNGDKTFTVRIHKNHINDFVDGTDYTATCAGFEYNAKIYYAEVNVDGTPDDSGYGDNTYVSKTYNSADNKVVQIVSTAFGKKGFFIGYEVTDAFIKNNTRVETAFTIGDEVGIGKTFRIRSYPLSETFATAIYKKPEGDKAWDDLTVESKLNVLVKSKITAAGYTVELFIPYEEFGLTEAPDYIYMLPITSYYKTANASNTSQYHKENGISDRESWDINLFSKFDKDGYVHPATKAPIVEYTFDNGTIVNTGTQTTVNGRATTNGSDFKISDIPNSSLTFTDGEFNDTNGALVLNNENVGGNHFTISNIDGIGTGDFTISVKIKITKATTKTSYENYLFGIGDAKDVGTPYFNIAYTNNKGNMQIRLRVDGTNVYSQYILVGEWIQFYVVKSDDNLTLYIDPMCKFKEANKTQNYYENYYKEVTLSSVNAINFTNDCNLGFASNEGCQNPGDYPVYFDDIRVYDYAFVPYPKGQTNV